MGIGLAAVNVMSQPYTTATGVSDIGGMLTRASTADCAAPAVALFRRGNPLSDTSYLMKACAVTEVRKRLRNSKLEMETKTAEGKVK